MEVLGIMNMAMELAADAPRKRPNGSGRDPILGVRAPPQLIELIRARAAERKVGVSALIRETLRQSVENGEGRDSAA
jgi:hypothetical protein